MRGHLLACAIATSLGMVIGCYSERLPPPAYRYACNADGDCGSTERCVDSLCQIPCTQATFAEDCPETGLYAYCFNGYCSSACRLSADDCPPPQECIDLGLSSPGGGSPFSGGGGGGGEPVGLCGAQCTQTSCPATETCLEGFCIPQCSADGQCPQGLVCQLDLCLPDLGDSAGTADTSTSAADGSTGASTNGDDDGTGTTGAAVIEQETPR